MSDELAVHISRDELHALEIPDTFETDTSFDVVLVNHGPSLHVHLHLDDDLSTVATIDAGNHYVEGESQRVVHVDVDPGHIPADGMFGKLKVVSAYGSETRWIDVQLTKPAEQTSSVEVDESLAEPQPREPEPRSQSPVDRPALPVLALGGVALVVALLVAVVIQQTLVTVGALAVVGGVLVALYVLSQDVL